MFILDIYLTLLRIFSLGTERLGNDRSKSWIELEEEPMTIKPIGERGKNCASNQPTLVFNKEVEALLDA